jgi:redox-sensing transcriptional repressor
MSSHIPEVVIQRLPLYLRAVELLSESKVETVSSNELGDLLEITPAQIRKDLSCFGHFGKQGKGYNVARLHKELKSILGLKHQWSMVLIGVGHLGRAILSYEGFGPQGFKIVACFDTDPKLIGKKMGNCIVQDVSQLEQKLKQGNIDIVIVAVPKDKAQKVIDTLVKCGIKAILNYAPIFSRVPEGVYISNVEPVLALQTLTFHLSNSK